MDPSVVKNVKANKQCCKEFTQQNILMAPKTFLKYFSCKALEVLSELKLFSPGSTFLRIDLFICCVCGRRDNLEKSVPYLTVWVTKTGLRSSGWAAETLPSDLSHWPPRIEKICASYPVSPFLSCLLFYQPFSFLLFSMNVPRFQITEMEDRVGL